MDDEFREDELGTEINDDLLLDENSEVEDPEDDDELSAYGFHEEDEPESDF